MPSLNEQSLKQMLFALEEPLKKLRQAGLQANIWNVIQLGTDEIRNTRILNWLLDANGSHDMGSIFLEALLEASNENKILALLNEEKTPNYLARTEVVYGSNRVDIEINAPTNFYLIIEVKIDAAEGKKQLERYLSILEGKSNLVNSHIIYLSRTLQRRPHKDQRVEQAYLDGKIIETTWDSFAKYAIRNLRQYLGKNTEGNYIAFTISTFLQHIKGFQ